MPIIFANDPGTRSYGWSVLQADKAAGYLRIRLITNGLCPSTAKDLRVTRKLRQDLFAYKSWVDEIVDTHQATAIVAERYMTRGISGPTIESINMMLGYLLMKDPKMGCRILPAVVWKNAVRRSGVDLGKWYKYCKTTPHQLDSALIGLFAANDMFGFKDYDGIRGGLQTFLPKFIERLEATSQEKLVERKIRKEPGSIPDPL